MTTYAAHPIYQVKKGGRFKKKCWVSKKQFHELQEQNYSYGSKVFVKLIKHNDNARYVELRTLKFDDAYDHQPIIVCDCGFQGKGELGRKKIERKTYEEEEYSPQCPNCGRQSFDVEFFQYLERASCSKISITERKITLSFEINQYHCVVGNFFQKFPDDCDPIQESRKIICLTYDFQEKRLYWINRTKGTIQDISWGFLSEKNKEYLRILLETDKGKKDFKCFLNYSLKKAEVNHKKRRDMVKLIQSSTNENPIITYSYGPSFEKEVFLLLKIPSLQAIDSKRVIASIRKAPTYVKQALKRAEGKTSDILNELYGYANKRMMRNFANEENIFFLHFFRPLFQNPVYLLDVVERIKFTEVIFAKGYWSSHYDELFSGAEQAKEKYFPYLETLKKNYSEERIFRNELVSLLTSKYCHGHPQRMFQFIEDIFRMEKLLLRILPKNHLPKRSSLIALHHAYVKTINDNRAALNAVSEEDRDFKYVKLEKELEEISEEGYRIRLAKNPRDLAMIGKELDNCVRGYFNEVYQRESLILVMEEKDAPVVCIEVKPGPNGWELIQASRRSNGFLSEVQRKRMEKWVQKHHIENKDYDILLILQPWENDENKKNDYQQYRKNLPIQENNPINEKTVKSIMDELIVEVEEVIDDDLPF